MSYLILSDYKKQIQVDNLNQIIGNDLRLLHLAELQAVEEAYGYLAQKYDTTQEFSATEAWSKTPVYYPTERIYLDAFAYSAQQTYAIGDLCLQAGNIYTCTTPITVAEAFNPAKWTILGEQYKLFYGKYPEPLFDYEKMYRVGDKVYWKGKKYTCLKASIDYSDNIQFRAIENIPGRNVFPDDPVAGSEQWGAGLAYSIPAGTLPTNADYWTAGDNRTQSILMIVIDIALFHIHSRIAPRNIPELRQTRYDNAIDMLRAFARGEMTAKLPVIQPKRGSRIRFGGNIKNINSY